MLGLAFQRVFRFIMFIFLGLAQVEILTADALSQSSKTADPADSLSHIDVYLHTIDKGDLVYNNFGHTALRVVDRIWELIWFITGVFLALVTLFHL